MTGRGARPRPATALGGAPVWLATAAALAAAGGRQGRRAALRALLSVTVASGLARAASAGFALTSAFKPPAAAAGVSSAVAFSAGAAMEWPALAPCFGAAGLAVARRAGTPLRLPWLAGAGALGLGVALVTRRAWPVPPQEGASARPVLDGDVAPTLPDGRGVVLVANPDAGHAFSGSPVEQVCELLPEAEVVRAEHGDDFGALVHDAAARAEVLAVCGGDGSVNAAAAAALHHDVPLLVVPGGTLNHLARDLGIDDVVDAVAALRRGRLVALDVGTIAGRPFLNTASFGGYPELVDARERLERRVGKWAAMVVGVVGLVTRAAPVAVEIDGAERQVWMVFVGNCRYRPAGLAPSWRERLDDGNIDVRVVDAAGPWFRLRLVTAALTGRVGRCRVFEQRVASRVRVRSLEGPLRLARDGETFDGPEEFEVGKDPRRLSVYVPHPDG